MAASEQVTPVNACFKVKCDKCGKTTWKGCGAHVEQVSVHSICLMAHLPPSGLVISFRLVARSGQAGDSMESLVFNLVCMLPP
ncbi:hypothetical protein IEO21_06194 [Rhodonia placenta]|uniref:Uncharacterized protein n=1 Tax=Rhodonia placenta TaxID=104341 RepID=A0A8H7P0H1_9APHY|nr:hypothetical protein IEO21_06194 [Postia placenta]